MKAFLKAEMARRFKFVESTMPLALATLLDPRFMATHFKNPMSVSKAKGVITNEIKKMFQKEADEAVESSSAAMVTDDDSLPPSPEENGGKSLWSSHDALIQSVSVRNVTDNLDGLAATEISAFFSRAPCHRDENPLKIWEALKHQFPHMYNLAMLFVPTLATSVPSERLFSLAGRIMTDDRNRLLPRHLSQRIFLASIDEKYWGQPKISSDS